MKTTSLLSILLHILNLSTPSTACILEAERHGGHIVNRAIPLTKRQEQTNLTNANTVPIGTGDRFANGTTPPRGIGSRPPSETTNLTGIPELSTIYNVAEIRSAVLALQHAFPSKVSYFELPHKTHLNATQFGAKILSPAPSEYTTSPTPSNNNSVYTTLLQSGIHARERGGPDHLLNFISDLLHADALSLPLLTYGGSSFTLPQIRTVLSLGIVILPLVNPDGVAHDQTTSSCWRKNRNPASGNLSDPNSVGVDLNRNFAPVWNFTKYLAPGTDTASFDPASEIFAGTGPLSEPETRNVDWVMDEFPGLGWFVDLHSMAGLVLYGWGHDSNQATDPEMNFANEEYDGKRGVIPDDPVNGTVYKEYMDEGEWDVLAVVAGRVAGGMTDSTAREYSGKQAVGLYPLSGSAADHGRWRKVVGGKGGLLNGLTVEFGTYNEEAECPFYPTLEMHRLSMIENGAGFMEFLLAAVRFGM